MVTLFSILTEVTWAHLSYSVLQLEVSFLSPHPIILWEVWFLFACFLQAYHVVEKRIKIMIKELNAHRSTAVAILKGMWRLKNEIIDKLSTDRYPVVSNNTKQSIGNRSTDGIIKARFKIGTKAYNIVLDNFRPTRQHEVVYEGDYSPFEGVKSSAIWAKISNASFDYPMHEVLSLLCYFVTQLHSGSLSSGESLNKLAYLDIILNGYAFNDHDVMEGLSIKECDIDWTVNQFTSTWNYNQLMEFTRSQKSRIHAYLSLPRKEFKNSNSTKSSDMASGKPPAKAKSKKVTI